ncbi:MmgE/PrpD family protein [Alcaligenaceae bacterium]|nr:MmgE/PrpD family protein [Alcaligenaceae bacterium]
MNTDITARLVRAIASAGDGPLPAEATETTKACLLDTLGVAIAGSAQPLLGILDATLETFQGAEQATLWTRGRKAPVHEAALFNGAAAHALDFDDMHIASAMHPSAPVTAAVLAVAEFTKADGAAILRAATLGIEAEIRIGVAVNPSHYRRGWHATGTLGHFGAAIAASSLMGLSEAQTVAALGIAGTQAGGLKEAFGTMTKPLHAGIAARNGVMAALLAARGFTSAADILGGPQGFGQALSDDPQWNDALFNWDPAERPWVMYEILYKIHASSFCTQALIEAVLTLKAEHGLEPGQVRAMHGQVSHLSMDNARIIEPKTGLEAKFSLPHAMAQAVTYGHARVEDFTDARVGEVTLRNLRAATRVTQGEGDGLAWPEAIATIELNDGRSVTEHADLRQRTATARDKWRVAEAKFMDVTAGRLAREGQQSIVQAVRTLDGAPGIGGLLGLLP